MTSDTLPIELDCWLIKWGFHDPSMVPVKAPPQTYNPGWKPSTPDEQPPF